MAANPTWEGTPRFGGASLTTGNTSRTGAGTTDVLTGVTAGTKIDRVVIQSTGQPADSVILLYYYDGSTAWDMVELDIGAPVAGSTTVAAYHNEIAFPNLILAGSTHKLQASVQVTPTSGNINVLAFGGDLT